MKSFLAALTPLKVREGECVRLIPLSIKLYSYLCIYENKNILSYKLTCADAVEV